MLRRILSIHFLGNQPRVFLYETTQQQRLLLGKLRGRKPLPLARSKAVEVTCLESRVEILCHQTPWMDQQEKNLYKSYGNHMVII